MKPVGWVDSSASTLLTLLDGIVKCRYRIIHWDVQLTCPSHRTSAEKLLWLDTARFSSAVSSCVIWATIKLPLKIKSLSLHCITKTLLSLFAHLNCSYRNWLLWHGHPSTVWKENSEVLYLGKHCEVGLTLHFFPSCVYYPSFFMSFGWGTIVWPIKWANCCCYQCKLTFVYLGSLTTWCSTVAVCGSSTGLDVLSACFAFIWCNFRANCLNVSLFLQHFFIFGSSWSNVWKFMNEL